MASAPQESGAALDDYLVKALDQSSASGTLYYPPPGQATDQAVLKRNARNRVVVFSGAFNPPHQGHLECINHALDTETFLAPIAVIFFPLEDSEVRERTGASGLVLSQANRIELMQAQLQTKSKYYLFQGPQRSFDDFLNKLRGCIREDGFEVRLVKVMGGDFIREGQLLMTPMSSTYDEWMINCTTSRPVDFMQQDGLIRPPGCQAWWNVDGQIEGRLLSIVPVSAMSIHTAQPGCFWHNSVPTVTGNLKKTQPILPEGPLAIYMVPFEYLDNAGWWCGRSSFIRDLVENAVDENFAEPLFTYMLAPWTFQKMVVESEWWSNLQRRRNQ